jgi:Tfp pilus assembly protein PilV
VRQLVVAMLVMTVLLVGLLPLLLEGFFIERTRQSRTSCNNVIQQTNWLRLYSSTADGAAPKAKRVTKAKAPVAKKDKAASISLEDLFDEPSEKEAEEAEEAPAPVKKAPVKRAPKYQILTSCQI